MSQDVSSSTGSASGVGFIMEGDMSDGLYCDPYAQDCAPGKKCIPASLDGDTAWEATICVDLAPHPVAADAPCRRTGEGDDCPAGMWCWDLDPDTELGMCIELCSGSEQTPTCVTPNTQCNTAKDGWGICFPICDPLVIDTCPVGCECIYIDTDFQCIPDASGELGAHGDPCEYLNACDPGHMCISSELIPDCTGSGCCSRFCNLDAPQCPDPTLVCTPFFEPGSAPPGEEDIGLCTRP